MYDKTDGDYWDDIPSQVLALSALRFLSATSSSCRLASSPSLASVFLIALRR